MNLSPSQAEVQFIVVTPLYGFATDHDELNLVPSVSLVKYSPGSLSKLLESDPLSRALNSNQPGHLVLQRPVLTLEEVAEVCFHATSAFSHEQSPSDARHHIAHLDARTEDLFFRPARNFFRTLRLFKSGRIVAGDSFVVGTYATTMGTVFSHRSSESRVDFGLLPIYSSSYELLSTEVPFFSFFSQSILPVISAQERGVSDGFSPIELALSLYCEDEQVPEKAIISAFQAFEALLTAESNAELSYRLSLRVANLLESDDRLRLEVFREIKEFYELRSKIVHGSTKLTPRLQSRLENPDRLRELLRRTILSVLALQRSQRGNQARAAWTTN